MRKDKSNKIKGSNNKSKVVGIPIPNKENLMTVAEYFSDPFEMFGRIAINPPNIVQLIREKTNSYMNNLNDFEIGRIYGALGAAQLEIFNRKVSAYGTDDFVLPTQDELIHIFNNALASSIFAILDTLQHREDIIGIPEEVINRKTFDSILSLMKSQDIQDDQQDNCNKN